MNAYMCTVCGFLYDEESADKNVEGNPVPFEDLEEEWSCPICGVRAALFEPTESNRTPDLPTSSSS